MSLVLPVLYHWSPAARRAGIKRRGLTPHTHTAIFMQISAPPTGLREGEAFHDPDRMVEAVQARAVCLGTSPSHAWMLSGGIDGPARSEWDLWQIALDDDDHVSQQDFIGYRFGELRVLNRILPSQLWLVGTRTCNSRRPY